MVSHKLINLRSAGLSGIEIPNNISLLTTTPTYLKTFICEKQVDIIYNEVFVENATIEASFTKSSKDFDVTGSPLKLEMADESFNDELENYKKMRIVKLWHQNEESHVPISYEYSILLMNNYLAKKSNTQKGYQWIWFLVDSSNIILVGSKLLDNYWYNASIEVLPNIYYNDIDLNLIMKKHLAKAMLTYDDVLITVSAEYDLLDDKFNTSEVGESVKLQINWKELSLVIPLLSGETILKLDLFIGSEFKCEKLWSELCQIQYLYNIIMENQNTSNDMLYKIIFPDTYSDIYEKVEENLQALMRQDCDYDEEDEVKDHSAYLSSALHKGRSSLSFCDKLWLILKDVSSYNQLMRCFNVIFNTIAHEKINVKVQSNSNTHLEKLIHDLLNQRAAVPLLSGLQPFELLLEIGVEKLCKDYIFIFEDYKLIHDKIPFYDIPKKTSENILYSMKPRLTVLGHSTQISMHNCSQVSLFQNSRFEENVYKHKFKILSRVHVVLENLVATEKILKLELNTLPSICSNLMKAVLYGRDENYKPPDSLNDLIKNVIQSINIPIETSLASSIINELNPTSLHIKFLTDKDYCKINAQYYFSTHSIFPPSILESRLEGKSFDYNDKEEKKKSYYGVYYFSNAHPYFQITS